MMRKRCGARKDCGVKGRSSSDVKQSDSEDDALLREYESSTTTSTPTIQHTHASTSRIGMMCAAVSVVLYFNSVANGGFTFDDNPAVVNNPDVLDRDGDGIMSPFSNVWSNDFWGTHVESGYTHKSYRPLVVLSFRLDATVSQQAWMFHLTNTLLYAFTAYLMVDVTLSKSVSTVQTTVERKEHLLLCSGLWFASHPIHTEAVAGIVGRAEILAAIFCLFGTKLYMENIISAALCFGAACLCKETAVVMPMILLGCELAQKIVQKDKPKPSDSALGLVLRSLCMIGVSVGYLLFRSILFAGKGGSVKGRPEDNFVPFLGKMDRFRTALFIMAKYFQLLVWPDKLACDYGLGVVDPVTSWLSGEIAFTAIVALIVAALSFKALLDTRQTGDATLLMALGWIFGPLIPASHILDIGTVLAERLLFLPSIGMAMLICNLLGQQSRSKMNFRKYSTVVMSVIVFVFASKTMSRVPDWASMTSLCSADVKTYPEGLKLNTMMASVLLNSSAEDALLYVERALETGGRYEKKNTFVDSHRMDNTLKANIYGDRGCVLLRIAQGARNNETIFQEALESFREMQRRDVGRAVPHFAYCDFGLVLVFLGRKEEAYSAFRTCLERTGLTGTSIEYKHVRNFATLMRELSGVAAGDPNLAKLRGREALEAFQRVINHRDASLADAAKWERQVDILKQLMTKSSNVQG